MTGDAGSEEELLERNKKRERGVRKYLKIVSTNLFFLIFLF